MAIGVIHGLSVLAFVPWFFSWTGVALWIAGQFVYGTLGMTLGYHRLLTHKSFMCRKWLEHVFATFGICCLEDTPARWVAIHRKHHQHSDEPQDPHSPLVDRIWSHIGWLVVENPLHGEIGFYEQYARDILQDPFYLSLERHAKCVWIYVAHAALYFLAALGVGWVLTGRYWNGVQLGASWLVWGVFLRTVTVWHVTWSVNSLSHIWGYQNYETGDHSRNNWLVGIMAAGEGWHNNHHADQRSACHGHKWWEWDVTYWVIRILKTVGLAWNVVLPRITVKS
jgi:stearoyl-CoA desaturase (delta-9 desaturase)